MSSPSPVPGFEQQEKQFARAFAVIRKAIDDHAFPGAALAVTLYVKWAWYRRLLEIRVGPQRQVEKPTETASIPETQSRI